MKFIFRPQMSAALNAMQKNLVCFYDGLCELKAHNHLFWPIFSVPHFMILK